MAPFPTLPRTSGLGSLSLPVQSSEVRCERERRKLGSKLRMNVASRLMKHDVHVLDSSGARCAHLNTGARKPWAEDGDLATMDVIWWVWAEVYNAKTGYLSDPQIRRWWSRRWWFECLDVGWKNLVARWKAIRTWKSGKSAQSAWRLVTSYLYLSQFSATCFPRGHSIFLRYAMHIFRWHQAGSQILEITWSSWETSLLHPSSIPPPSLLHPFIVGSGFFVPSCCPVKRVNFVHIPKQLAYAIFLFSSDHLTRYLRPCNTPVPSLLLVQSLQSNVTRPLMRYFPHPQWGILDICRAFPSSRVAAPWAVALRFQKSKSRLQNLHESQKEVSQSKNKSRAKRECDATTVNRTRTST